MKTHTARLTSIISQRSTALQTALATLLLLLSVAEGQVNPGDYIGPDAGFTSLLGAVGSGWSSPEAFLQLDSNGNPIPQVCCWIIYAQDARGYLKLTGQPVPDVPQDPHHPVYVPEAVPLGKCYATQSITKGQSACQTSDWSLAIAASFYGPSHVCLGNTCHPPLNPPSPAGGSGDPHFVGFDGTKFDFHGHAGQTYALLSEPSHQVNSRFIPSDPADTVQPGTYMGIISVLVSNNVQMKFEVKGYNFMQVTVNGKVLDLSGDPMIMEERFGPVSLKTEHRYESFVSKAVVSKATIETSLFRFVIWSSSGNKYNNGTAISAAPVSNLHETPYLLFTVSIKQSLPEGPESLHGLVGLTLPWALDPSSASIQDATTQAIGMDDSFPKPSNIGAFQNLLASKESWFLVENIWASDCKINRFAKKKVPEASLPPIEKFAEHDVARRLLVEDISNSAGFPSNGFPLNAGILVGGV